MPDAGDWRVPWLAITPGDGTTAASYVVVAPDGTVSSPVTASISGTGDSRTATGTGYELTVAGEWVERWTVTGTGRSMERAVILVAPDPATAFGGRVYATTTDYAAWLLAAPPAGSRRALRAASVLIEREMLRTATYDVDDDGLPTDAEVIAALREATCAQAEHARTRGDATLVGAGQVSGFTIGRISVTKGVPSGQQPAAGLPAHWSPAAYDALHAVPPEKLSWEIWSY